MLVKGEPVSQQLEGGRGQADDRPLRRIGLVFKGRLVIHKATLDRKTDQRHPQPDSHVAVRPVRVSFTGELPRPRLRVRVTVACEQKLLHVTRSPKSQIKRALTSTGTPD